MHAAPCFLRRGSDQHSNRLSGLPVLADYLADVALRYTQLNECTGTIIHLSNFDGIRIVYERPGDRRHEFFHVLPTSNACRHAQLGRRGSSLQQLLYGE
jgi:hypothetical protein